MNAAEHRLRVNVKSLAAEARIIRTEMRRAQDTCSKASLAYHRSQRLKPEARLAHLALAFVRQVPYKRVETNAKQVPLAAKVFKKLNRFMIASQQDVDDWLAAG